MSVTAARGVPGWSGGGIGRVWYRSGEAQQDVLRAELEADRLKNDAINLIKPKRIAQAGLAALVQQPISLLPEAQQEIATPGVPQDLEALIASAEQLNPELRALVWKIRRDWQRMELMGLQHYPDLQLEASSALVDELRRSVASDGSCKPLTRPVQIEGLNIIMGMAL